MIWFDVTDIMHWWRPPVGIIRAQIEIGNGLADTYGDGLRFCVYQSGRFQMVLPGELRLKLAALTSGNVQAFSLRNKPPRARLQSLYGLILDHGPSMIANPLRAIVRQGKIMLHKTPADLSGSRLAPGDVYVSLGGDWDAAGKMASLHDLRNHGVRIALCCYDLIPALFPNFYGEVVAARFVRYLDGAISAADTILCDSENTKSDLVSYIAEHGHRSPRVTTFQLGADRAAAPVAVAEKISRDFIVYVSTLERRKNHDVLYKAYVTIREQHLGDPPLCVFVGMPTPNAAELLSDISLDPRVRGDFLVLKNLADPGLQWLYEHCLFTVFPSLYEGWGLPIAESLRNGKLVLASTTSSIPEVGRSSVEYIDPWDVSQWADRIMFYATNRDALGRREAGIRASFQPHQWVDTIRLVAREVELLARTEPAAGPDGGTQRSPGLRYHT